MRFDLIDLLVSGGVILIGLGAWLIHPALGLIAAGMMAVIAGFLLANFRR